MRRTRMSIVLGRALPALAVVLLTPGAAVARIEGMIVPVSGMTCALCTRGVEESIRRLKAVDGVSANLKLGLVRVDAARDHSLDIREVKRSVAEAGFQVAGECDLIATGTFTINSERRVTFAIRDTPHVYRVLENNQTLRLFTAHPALKGVFTLRFRLHAASESMPAVISILDLNPGKTPPAGT